VVIALGLIAVGALLFMREPATGAEPTRGADETGAPLAMPAPPVADREADLPPASLPGSSRRVDRKRRPRDRSFLGPLTLVSGWS
jgi:hypothetical protein